MLISRQLHGSSVDVHRGVIEIDAQRTDLEGLCADRRRQTGERADFRGDQRDRERWRGDRGDRARVYGTLMFVDALGEWGIDESWQFV